VVLPCTGSSLLPFIKTRRSLSLNSGDLIETLPHFFLPATRMMTTILHIRMTERKTGKLLKRALFFVKPRKSRRRFFANERAVRTHRCCSSCKETALDNGIFQVVSVNAGMIAFKLQGQKCYAAKCEFRANSSNSKLYQITAGVS
jgi:hypothetical protein